MTLGLLAFIAIVCAVFEGLFELPAQFVQFTGLLSVVSAFALIGWSMMIKTDDASPD